MIDNHDNDPACPFCLGIFEDNDQYIVCSEGCKNSYSY